MYSDAKDLIKGVDNDLNRVLDRGSGVINKVVDKTADVINNGQTVIGGTVSNLGQSLSNPLMIGGLAIAAILLIKKW